MPRLVRRLEFPPEESPRTCAGEDIDLRWNPATGTVELVVSADGNETTIALSREALRTLITLAQEVERALADAEEGAR